MSGSSWNDDLIPVFFFLGLFLLSPFPLLVLGIRGLAAGRRRAGTVWLSLGIPLLALVLFCSYLALPLGNQELGHLTLPDGTEMVLRQKCNYSGEPYTTRFYHRLPGEAWQWHYIDHQDVRWFAGGLKWDEATRTATLVRNWHEFGRFDLSDHTLYIGDRESPGSPREDGRGPWD